jgi:patatin-related protein
MQQQAINGRTREVRIGLVMYGGVSLAIYMNGIANELFRAVRGRGVYRLFKQLTDSDVVVDVVSGASAGGINGMFLAFALCNEREFGECADLWRQKGGISDLLREPGGDAAQQTSLLDSDGYYQSELAGAFAEMWKTRIPQGKDAPSAVQELDLFVAGTDFNGRKRTAVDSAAHVIDVKDHRVRFWLKHRAERKTQLNPCSDAFGRGGTHSSAGAADASPPEVGFEALARLARITSCFPGAFAHVEVNVPGARRDPKRVTSQHEREIGAKLGVWGALPEGTYHFLDGGILDNKPFTSTIEAIYYRMANRPVQRHLLYVEPDPERFQRQGTRVPTFLTSALDSLTRLPSYESIAGDLQQIAKHNDAIERYKRTCAELRNWVMPHAKASEKPEPAGVGREWSEAQAIYENARLESLVELAAEGLLDLQQSEEEAAEDAEPEKRKRLEEPKERMTQLRHAFDAELTRTRAGAKNRSDVDAILEAYDVQFRLRRLMHLTYVLMPPIRHPSQGTPAEKTPTRREAPTPAQQLSFDDRREALLQIGHRIALLEIVRAKVLRAIETSAADWQELDAKKVWGRLKQRLDAMLDVAGLPKPVRDALSGETSCQEQLGALSEALEQRVLQRQEATAPMTQSLLALADQGEEKLLGRFVVSAEAPDSAESQPHEKPQRPIEHEYQRFDALDQVLFPIQFVGDLYEQDIIRTVRVSPIDARRGCSRVEFADKVTGETLGHFGAFLKKSWRTNDILFGRLDGSCQLIETLLNPSWLLTTLEQPEQRQRVLTSFGISEEAAQKDAEQRTLGLKRWLLDPRNDVFPNAGEAVERVARALSALLDPSTLVANFEKEKTRGPTYEELLDALVEATHYSILQADYHQIITDSLEEQLRWQTANVKRAVNDTGSKVPAFDIEKRAFDHDLDPLAVLAAAHQFARDAKAKGQDSQSLARLLRESPVGREDPARDIPASVLIELAARSLLILRNCIVNSLGLERAAAVRRHRAYQVFVDWPLRAFHALAKLLRDRPVHGGVALGLLAYFSLAALIDVVFFPELIGQSGWRGYVAACTFVGLPLICLGAATTLVILTEYSWKALRTPTQRMARQLLISIAGLTLLLACGAVVYVAYAYVSNAINPVVEPLLARLALWPPEGFDRPGDVVVLAVLSALSFGIGKWTQRRLPASSSADSRAAQLGALPQPRYAGGALAEGGPVPAALAGDQPGEPSQRAEQRPDGEGSSRSPRSAPAHSAPAHSAPAHSTTALKGGSAAPAASERAGTPASTTQERSQPPPLRRTK